MYVCFFAYMCKCVYVCMFTCINVVMSICIVVYMFFLLKYYSVWCLVLGNTLQFLVVLVKHIHVGLAYSTTYIKILSIHKGMFWYFVTTKRSQILKQTATFCKVREYFNFHRCNVKTFSSKYVTKLRILRCNLTIPHQPWPKYRWTNSMERCNMVRLMLGIF